MVETSKHSIEILLYNIVLYIATASYLLLGLTFAKMIPNLIHEKEYIWVFANIVQITAYIILTYFVFHHIKSNKTEETEETQHDNEQIIGYPSNYGYGLLAFFQVIALFFEVGSHFNYYTILGFLGYLLLFIKQNVGVFIILGYYISNIVSMIFFRKKLTQDDKLITIARVGLVLYFGTYVINYIRKHI